MCAPKPSQVRSRDRLPEKAEGMDACILRRKGFEVLDVDMTVRKVAQRETAVRIYVAKFNPTEEERVAAAGASRYRRRGYTAREYVVGNDWDDKPAVVRASLPRLQLWDEEEGTWGTTVICRPRGFDAELKIADEAIAWIEAHYASMSLREIEQATGVRYPKIRAIGKRIVVADEAAMAASDYAPAYYAIDKVFMADEVGGLGGYINVTALGGGLKPVVLGRVALFEEREYRDARGGKRKYRVEKPEEKVVTELAVIYARPPVLSGLLGVAMDGEKWLARIDRAAWATVGESRPDIGQIPQVRDRWHCGFNVKKPFKALITKLRKKLPRGEKSRVERWMLSRLSFYLVHACWHELADNDSALWDITAILERFEELEAPFWVVKLFLEVQAAPDLATAQERYAGWQAALTEEMRATFKGAIDYIEGDLAEFLAYFEIKERTGLSVTSSPVESQNRQDKVAWVYARSSSAALLEEKSIARAGIGARLRQAELEARQVPQRRRKKKKSAAGGSAEPAPLAAAA